MPVYSDGLEAFVDDGDGDGITFVPDQMRARRLAVDEPRRTERAVCIVRTIGDLRQRAVNIVPIRA